MWQAGVDLIRSYDLAIELVSQGYVTVEGGKARLLRSYELYPPSIFRSRIWRSGSKRRGEFGSRSSTSARIPRQSSTRTCGNTTQLTTRSFQLQFKVTSSHSDHSSTRITRRPTAPRWERSSASRSPGQANHLETARRQAIRPRNARGRGGGLGHRAWRVWLDPKCNYLPVRTKQWFVKSGRTMLDREIENELAEVEPGVSGARGSNDPRVCQGPGVTDLRQVHGNATSHCRQGQVKI